MVQLHDVAKELLEAEEAERRQRIIRGLAGPSGDYPPFSIEYSSNLREYSAAQDIPNFGVHAFYALSKEPLNTWDNLTTTIFPRGTVNPFQMLYFLLFYLLSNPAKNMCFVDSPISDCN